MNSIASVNQFTKTTKERYFVDKSGLITKMNELIGTASQYVCITRPRRFGKTLNAMMLASYYSKNTDCKNIFDKLEISKDESYLEHLNKHNVIYITFNSNASDVKTYSEYIEFYKTKLVSDITALCSGINTNDTISEMLTQTADKTGQGFIFIIDDWDYIFNNNLFSEGDRKEFLEFLRGLLKDKSYVELAYMTGVLPIAKYSAGSAINMFLEFNIMTDHMYDEYFGFTNDEVENLCLKQNKLSMGQLKEWYNGYYTCNDLQIYNPRSVTTALKQGVCQSYWTNTGPMDEIIYYINNDVGAVKDDIVSMVSGIPLEIKLKGYSAEQKELNTRNQILSAMTIYGFLSYHDKTLEIPNKELRIKFDVALEDNQWARLQNLF